MVSLPITQSEQTEVTQAPRSAVSGAYISSAFDKLGRGLDDLGQNFQAAQDENANLRGSSAVYRDADGQLQVTTESALSQSGRIFNRSARQAYLAQTSSDARVALLDLRKKSNGDAASFQAAYDGYRAKYLEKADSLMAGPIAQTLDSEFNNQHEGMLQDQFKQDTDNNRGKITNEISTLTNETAALARGGATDSPEYNSKMDAIRQLGTELTGNPLFGITKAEADKQMKSVINANMGEYIAGKTESIFKEKGYKAAIDFAQKEIWDSKLDLTPAERHQYESQATSDIRQIMAGRKSDLRELKYDATQMLSAIHDGAPIDGQEFDKLTSDLAAGGDPITAHKLVQARIDRKMIGDNTGATDSQNVDNLEKATKRQTVVNYILGAESNFKADAKNTKSTATGAGQVIESTWLDLVRKNEPSLMDGRTKQQVLDLRKDYNISKRMVAAYVEENAINLTNHGLPATNGNIYLSHFAGPAGAVALLKADPNASASQIMAQAGNKTIEKLEEANPFLKGMTAQDIADWSTRKMGANISPEVYKSYRAEVQSDMKALWPKIVEGIQKSGDINHEDVALLFKQMALVGDEDFVNNVKTVLPAVAQFLDQPVAQMENDLHEMEAHSLTATERSVYEMKKAIYDKREVNIKKDPLGLVMTEQAAADPGPIPWGTNGVSDNMAKREKAAGVARQLYNTPDVPVFRPAEAEQAAAKLYSSKPEDQQEIVRTLTNLKDDNVMATISTKPIKEALLAGAQSTDYGKASNALAVMANAYHRSPQSFKKEFGDEALKSVQDWEGRLKYSTPDEMRLYQEQKKDPSFASMREKMETKGRELAGKVPAQEILKEFHGNRFNPLGNGPASDPTDPATVSAIQSDYANIYAERYSVLQNEDTAKSQTIERLKQSWAVSEANGGKLMLHAPESVFTTVDGTHKWVKDETHKSLIDAGYSNQEADASAPALKGPQKMVAKPWPYVLIADQATENAINSGKEPSWIVMVTNPKTGATDFARNKDGTQMFMSYGSLEVAQKTAELKFNEKRKQRQEVERILLQNKPLDFGPSNFDLGLGD